MQNRTTATPQTNPAEKDTRMNPDAIINQIMAGLGGGDGKAAKEGSGGGFPGGAAGAAAAAGLAGLFMGSKGGRKLAGKAVKYGGMAVLGGIAYRAWQKHQEGRADPPSTFQPPQDDVFLPDEGSERREALGIAVIRAMIAAAKADGHVDAEEQKRIFDGISALELASDDKAFLLDELTKPADPDVIAALSAAPETASELYAASVVVIGDPNRDERRYLDRLAGRLGLASDLQDAIEAEAVAAEA